MTEFDAVTQLDRRIQTVWQVGAAASLLPLVVAVIVAEVLLPTPPGLVGVPLLVVAAAAAVVLPRLRYRSWSYQLRAQDLVIRFGVLWRVQRIVPRPRVQHVDLASGPIERALGLRSLAVYTAGTKLADVTIPGLTVASAEWLRDQLLAEARR